MPARGRRERMPTAECPSCGERFYVVSIEDADDHTGTTHTEPADSPDERGRLDVRLVDSEERDPRHPYPAEADWEEERIEEDIDHVWARFDAGGEAVTVDYFGKPPDDDPSWAYVVRASTDAGSKSKNVLVTDDGELYVKNRGVPWEGDKQWTYLDEDELERRSAVAGLGDVIELPETEGGLGLLLGTGYRPLVEDGSVRDDLLLTLAKTLLVFQSGENPAA